MNKRATAASSANVRAPRKRVFSIINGPEIPRFYFPHGKADKTPYSAASIEAAFGQLGGSASLAEFTSITKVKFRNSSVCVAKACLHGIHGICVKMCVFV